MLELALTSTRAHECRHNADAACQSFRTVAPTSATAWPKAMFDCVTKPRMHVSTAWLHDRAAQAGQHSSPKLHKRTKLLRLANIHHQSCTSVPSSSGWPTSTTKVAQAYQAA